MIRRSSAVDHRTSGLPILRVKHPNGGSKVMRVRHFHNALLASAGSLALVGCGGGRSVSTALIPPPPVTPTPTLVSVQIFPNVTTTTDFAAIGVQATRTASPTVANASVS